MSETSATGADDGASLDAIDREIRRLAHRMNHDTYRLLLLVREFDERRGWAKWAHSSCAEWLRWRIGIGLSAAREHVRVAHALPDLPKIARAFAVGRLSYSKVRALTRVANSANERDLLEYALKVPASQVEERCRQLRNVHPDAVESARCAWERRALSVFRNPSSHTMTIHVEMPLEEGEIVVRALEKAVQSGGVARGPEFGGRDRWQAQQADALVAIARVFLAEEPAPKAVANGDPARERLGAISAGETRGSSALRGSASADHYQVLVHVDEAALRGGAGRADMPIETIRRLACDGSIRVVTGDERGRLLDVGHKHRIVPPALRRILWARDRGCTFPGCENKRFVEAHHMRHWIEGGETTEENTALLCTHHHRLLHEGAFRMRRLADGSLEFRRPDGRVIPRCGYRADDEPDRAFLDEGGYSSAEAWLAALLGKGNRDRPDARPPPRAP